MSETQFRQLNKPGIRFHNPDSGARGVVGNGGLWFSYALSRQVVMLLDGITNELPEPTIILAPNSEWPEWADS